jgi:hypothetical protein
MIIINPTIQRTPEKLPAGGTGNMVITTTMIMGTSTTIILNIIHRDEIGGVSLSQGKDD